MIYKAISSSPAATSQLGEKLAHQLSGGEVIELSSDLGGGKTTFVKGLARGLGYDGDIVSPTFTVSRVYQLPSNKELHHFDFYRLAPGDITAEELAEAAGQPGNIVVIEWAGHVGAKLPKDRLTITFDATKESEREITFTGPEHYQHLAKGLSV